MKVTRQLHDVGKSFWLDNITRDLLGSGIPKHYIDELSAPYLTTAFESADRRNG